MSQNNGSIFLYVVLFLFGLVGVYFSVLNYNPVCTSGKDGGTCIDLLGVIYFAGLLMVLSGILAIRELIDNFS